MLAKQRLEQLQLCLVQRFPESLQASTIEWNELTIDVCANNIYEVSLILRDEFGFDSLMDVCGVDYLHYGLSEWDTKATTETGFSRAVTSLHVDHFEPTQENKHCVPWGKPRFGVVYHLLSVKENNRLRVQVFLEEKHLQLDSVVGVWASANWFEREAFDLFGIRFNGHPDLRRILTDYGFVGHPFRKDFPLIGHVEMRYDAKAQKCVYEPVSIQPRITVPKVIRKDNR